MIPSLRSSYPRHIWLLFWGTLTSSLGMSFVWPFLVIYIREQLDVELTTITLLMTVQSIAGIGATAFLSPLMDRFGRKRAMIGGLVGSGAVLVTMIGAHTLWQWAIIMPLYGVVNSIFRIGSYAMVADVIPPDRRAGVYALLRMGDNIGIAVGPALGGFLATVAYALSFGIAAATQMALAVLVTLFVAETLDPETVGDDSPLMLPTAQRGYGRLLHDRPFLTIWGVYALAQIANAMVFVLLGLYMKENYGLGENRFGFVVGTNAVLVVLFQYAITHWASRYPPLWIMVGGALFYAGGMGVFAVSNQFGLFVLGMVIFTVGELMLVPTATAFAANLAPADMRARYMGMFTLTFRVAAGVGPVIGGVLSDTIHPSATWYGGMVVCLVAGASFAMLTRRPAFVAASDTAQARG